MPRNPWRDEFCARSVRVVITSAIILIPILSFVSETGMSPPPSGDWIVLGEEQYSNTTIIVNGSLIITGTGRLTLDNVTLIINSTFDGQHRIQVNQSGVLATNNSDIRSYSPSYTYEFKVYGSLFLNRSTVENMFGPPFSLPPYGGIQVLGGSISMDHSNVTQSRSVGVLLIQARADLSNCDVFLNEYDELHVIDSDFVNITNCRFWDAHAGIPTSYGVYVEGSRNFSIKDSEVRDNPSFGMLVENSPGFVMNNSSVSGNLATGFDAIYVNTSLIQNSTFANNFGSGVSIEGSDGVRLVSNRALNNSAGGYDIYYVRAVLVNNTNTNSSGTGMWILNSRVTFIGNSDIDPGSGFSLHGGSSELDFFGDIFSGVLGFENSTVRAARIRMPSIHSESSDIQVENSTMTGEFDVWWGSHLTLLNTTVVGWEIFSVDYPGFNPDNPSEVVVKNFLNLQVLNETSSPLQGADILVEDDGADTYASPGFGGTDPVSDSMGQANWIVATDRVYRKDFNVPGHPFENITYNATSVFVSKSGYKFGSNPRQAEMNLSHTETFLAVPPLPPVNLTARLSGDNYRNVTLQWTLSPDEGNASGVVSEYNIFRGDRYDRTGSSYAFLTSVANGTNEFVDAGRGEADPSSYFYYVCASNPRNFSSCTQNQAGKFSRNLTAGPQLISVPLIPPDRNLSEVFKTLDYDNAWTYSSAQGSWMSLSKPKGFNELSAVNRSMGIWVNLTSADRFAVAGVVADETDILLRPGWNLVGFPSFNESYRVQDLIMETGAISVEGHDPLDPPYYLRRLGAADVLAAGKAYWIMVLGEVVWTLNN